jgi:hypothetical protein
MHYAEDDEGSRVRRFVLCHYSCRLRKAFTIMCIYLLSLSANVRSFQFSHRAYLQRPLGLGRCRGNYPIHFLRTPGVALFDSEKAPVGFHLSDDALVSSRQHSFDDLDIARPTVNGGYSHTTSSRAKISAANKGKTPWNKGRVRSEEEKARIAAGVLAFNRQRFLDKLKTLNLTEEEYVQQQKELRRVKDAERRSRRTEKGGYTPTDETRQKISRILKEKHARGEVKPRAFDPNRVRRGFKQSEETRLKISESLRKRWANDPNYRSSMVEKSVNANTKDDVRKRISDTLREKWKDPEYRSNMLAKMATRKARSRSHDDSHRAKISQAIKAKWQDEEYRQKALDSIRLRKVSTDSISRPPKSQTKRSSRRSTTHKDNTDNNSTVDSGVVLRLEPKRPVAMKTEKKHDGSGVSDQHDGVVKKPRPRRTHAEPKGKPILISEEHDDFDDESDEPDQEPKTKLKKRPNGDVDLLKQERRDLFDLLYGEDEQIARVSDLLGDENLDDYDPYGLQDC